MSEPKGTRRPRTKKTSTTTPTDAAPPDAASAAPAVAVDVPAAVPPGEDASAETVSTVSHEHVAERAYHKFLARGGEHGRDAEDWVEAELELRIEGSGGAKRRPKKRR